MNKNKVHFSVKFLSFITLVSVACLAACNPTTTEDTNDSNSDGTGHGNNQTNTANLPAYMGLSSFSDYVTLNSTEDLQGTWVGIHETNYSQFNLSITRYISVFHVTGDGFGTFSNDCVEANESPEISFNGTTLTLDPSYDDTESINSEFNTITIDGSDQFAVRFKKISDAFLSIGTLTVNGTEEDLTCFSQGWTITRGQGTTATIQSTDNIGGEPEAFTLRSENWHLSGVDPIADQSILMDRRIESPDNPIVGEDDYDVFQMTYQDHSMTGTFDFGAYQGSFTFSYR